MIEHRRLFTRRIFLKGAVSASVALGANALFPQSVYEPATDSGSFDPSSAAAANSERLAELGYRTIQEAIDACETRRRQFSMSVRPRLSTLLAHELDTDLAQSKKLGLRGAHLWDESERLDWHVPFAFAVNPNAAPVNGKTIWFTNTPTVAIFREDPFGNSLEHIENRMIWAMHKGAEALAVVEIEDDQGVANLAKLTTLLVRLGVKTIVLGNEPDNDLVAFDRRVPQRFYNAGIIVQDTFLRLGQRDRNILLAASDFEYRDYGQNTRRLYEAVAACGDRMPFNGFSWHYYGIPEELPAWERNQGRFTKDVSGMSHFLTEVGIPLGIMTSADYTTDEVWAGMTTKILTLAAASSFFSRVYYHALLDGENEKHSLARISGHKLISNISYSAYQHIARLFANPLEEPTIIEETDIMGAFGKRRRNDGTVQNFAVVWARGTKKEGLTISPIQIDPMLTGAQVFDMLGQPTEKTNTVTLSAQTPKILIANAT